MNVYLVMGGYYYSNEVMSSASIFDTHEEAQKYGAELLTSGLFEFFQIKKMTLNVKMDFRALFRDDDGVVIPPTRECFCKVKTHNTAFPHKLAESLVGGNHTHDEVKEMVVYSKSASEKLNLIMEELTEKEQEIKVLKRENTLLKWQK